MDVDGNRIDDRLYSEILQGGVKGSRGELVNGYIVFGDDIFDGSAFSFVGRAF